MAYAKAIQMKAFHTKTSAKRHGTEGTAARKAATPQDQPRPKLSDDAMYQQIIAAIMDRRLPPGTRLPEESLTEAFGVSRTRIRKILQRLSNDKVIVLKRNRGATVAQPTAAEARTIFEARCLIETATVRAFATRANRAAIHRIEQLVEAEAEARAQGQDQVAINLAGKFHIEIAKLFGNEILTDLINLLVSKTSQIFAVFQSSVASICTMDDHRDMLAAIKAHDSDLAARIMGDHLLRMESSVDLTAKSAATVDLTKLFSTASKRRD